MSLKMLLFRRYLCCCNYNLRLFGLHVCTFSSSSCSFCGCCFFFLCFDFNKFVCDCVSYSWKDSTDNDNDESALFCALSSNCFRRLVLSNFKSWITASNLSSFARARRVCSSRSSVVVFSFFIRRLSCFYCTPSFSRSSMDWKKICVLVLVKDSMCLSCDRESISMQ